MKKVILAVLLASATCWGQGGGNPPVIPFDAVNALNAANLTVVMLETPTAIANAAVRVFVVMGTASTGPGADRPPFPNIGG